MNSENGEKILSNVCDNFDELIALSDGIQQRCKDFSASTKSLNDFYFNGDTCSLVYKAEDGSKRNTPFTKHSLSQFCSKIGVPAGYIDKCIDSGRLDLAEENVSSWLEDFNKELFIREYASEKGNRIRGVLSDRYSVFDTPDILRGMQDLIDPKEFHINGVMMNEERFHARLVKNIPLNVPKEDLFAGIQIDTSDVGRSVLSVKTFIFKLVCTNGLIAPRIGVLYQQKHFGITSEELCQGLSKTLLTVPDIEEMYSHKIAETMNKKASVLFDRFSNKDDPALEFVKNISHLTEDHSKKVLELMNSKYGQSQWGLINSLTEVAKEYTLERRLELEKVAGELLAA